MNTANLQLEGLLLALSSVIGAIEAKGLLTRQEIIEALDRAEKDASADPLRPPELSAAHVDAACFPIRFLRLAVSRAPDEPRGFTEIATAVGQTKPDH